MFCNRCGAGTSAGCKNVPCEFPLEGTEDNNGRNNKNSDPSVQSKQPDIPIYTSSPTDVGPYPDVVQSTLNATQQYDAARRAQGEESDFAGEYQDRLWKDEWAKQAQQSASSSSGGKVGPVVAFVAAAAVVLGIKSCMDDAPPSRTTTHTAGSSSPVYEPAGQRAPLKTYVKPDGQPVRMWADFQKSQLRVTIPEGACIEVLDKDHAFGMSSVTVQYNSGRYEHGLIEQTAKVIPAPECNNTMR